MKVALDPYMFRTTPLLELPALVAELGYEHIELSPRLANLEEIRRRTASWAHLR